jgi:hypothetical protein
MHQSLQVATFHIEHITPSSAGGPPSPDNLALACPSCNLRKANRLTARDPTTGDMVPLFHPRRHIWTDHFAWSGNEIVAKTPIGRAAIVMLDMNHARRLKVRIAESRSPSFHRRVPFLRRVSSTTVTTDLTKITTIAANRYSSRSAMYLSR